MQEKKKEEEETLPQAHHLKTFDDFIQVEKSSCDVFLIAPLNTSSVCCVNLAIISSDYGLAQRQVMKKYTVVLYLPLVSMCLPAHLTFSMK